LFLGFAFGTPVAFLLCAVFSNVHVPALEGLLGTFYVGLVEMSVTFVLWLLALRSSENTAKVSMLIFISPFFSLILIHFILGEEILRSTIVGLALIVAGLLLQRRRGG
jgi:drug/metabolite transporter (DMT)-like permease